MILAKLHVQICRWSPRGLDDVSPLVPAVGAPPTGLDQVEDGADGGDEDAADAQVEAPVEAVRAAVDARPPVLVLPCEDPEQHHRHRNLKHCNRKHSFIHNAPI